MDENEALYGPVVYFPDGTSEPIKTTWAYAAASEPTIIDVEAEVIDDERGKLQVLKPRRVGYSRRSGR